MGLPDIGYAFSRAKLLEQALTHSSSVDDALADNERLEFLGDRVLGLVVAHMLFERFPNEEEGDLAKRHAALVRKETLVRVANDLKLGDYLVLSRGEAGDGVKKDGMLADACEAVLGALFLDGGLPAGEAFIHRHWTALIEEDLSPPKDAKTALQEWAQGRGLPLPAYETKSTEGPAHQPVFTIEVSVKDNGSATGQGTSKRIAEQDAAKALLEKLT